MKKLRSLITVGAVYILFIFGFSFFDSFSMINKFLIEVGLIDANTEVTQPYFLTDMDPIPEPPFPPPGGDGD